MKKNKNLIMLSMISLLSSCFVSSINSICKEEKSIVIPELNGIWQGEHTRWTFNPSKDSVFYDLGYEECQDPIDQTSFYSKCTFSDFKTQFTKIDGVTYVNFQLADKGVTDNVFEMCHFMDVQSFAKVVINENTMNVFMPNHQWLEKHLTKHPEELKHIKKDNRIIITASTKELRDFVSKNQNKRAFFKESIELLKKAI